jgi:hypothetical protein
VLRQRPLSARAPHTYDGGGGGGGYAAAGVRPQSARPRPASELPAPTMRERPQSARPGSRAAARSADWDSRAYVMYATNPLSPYAGPILAQLRVGSAAEVRTEEAP